MEGPALSHLGLSWAAGSLTTLSPCVFPLLPLVVGGAVQDHPWAPVAMGAGMAASFAVLGVFLGAAGPALGLDGEVVRQIGAAMLVAVALTLWLPAWQAGFARWMAPLASRAQGVSGRFQPGSLGGALALGGLLGLVWSPCSGPLLASALALAASGDGGAARGAVLLGVFGLGAATPLVAVAYASRAGFQRARGWVLHRAEPLRRGFAVLLGVSGVAILSGLDKWLEARVLDRLPAGWVALTTAL